MERSVPDQLTGPEVGSRRDILYKLEQSHPSGRLSVCLSGERSQELPVFQQFASNSAWYGLGVVPTGNPEFSHGC